MGNADLGTLTRNGTNYTVSFTRHFAHPVDKVWRAMTEPEHTSEWFPHAIVGEWQPGAALRFESETGSFDGVGKAARDGAGWHECLGRLEVELDGGSQAAWNAGWRDLNRRYQEALGPEASTIGPPPDWQPAGD
jgi:hypothetical protein